ncbi:MAG: hypothetical protein QM831_44795 [Kofleriaceae bacterium]
MRSVLLCGALLVGGGCTDDIQGDRLVANITAPTPFDQLNIGYDDQYISPVVFGQLQSSFLLSDYWPTVGAGPHDLKIVAFKNQVEFASGEAMNIEYDGGDERMAKIDIVLTASVAQ